ncbi:DNA-processing protein DprA [Shouchella clausii]|uniref:DNA-processing protein DprA n=1 Tax=Shouchella TaxID=2893057 RepID=UPI0004E747BF|nr:MULTISPECIES: DNA-processing protein DprA [Shouchella]ALA55046.1 Rossmann fold nucleotide-binding protein Smf [Shouchella clausii]MBU3231019.1 DNA-processing protein DprA [Shouchella clausii]MBU3262906.1 DNA-processing protein DprA [Shouchella clausii]MBU3505370.1 DNA-processing protein DprA [Shouchella clausii]MBU3534387.1 DNA-processing protein DprA [Shouchella clausii]
MIDQILTLKYLGLENSLINKILKDFSSEEITKLFREDSLQLLFERGYSGSKLDKKLINKSYVIDIYNRVNEIIEESEKNGIKIISIYEDLYPEKLKKIDNENKPIVIFAKGNLNLLQSQRNIAAVGTRKPSHSTRDKIKETISNLSRKQVVIVSGLANGVDSLSHKACLDVDGKTIAVLAHGLDQVYPKSNKKLAEEIIKKDGLLISEYPLGESPKKKNFVERNRIVSGLSDLVVVFEADEHSGTMHTARFAYKQKKIIFCPFEEMANMSSGVRKLLLSGSAVPFNNANDIYDQLIGG